MKFICLGYMEEAKWDEMPASDRNAMITECLAYDDELQGQAFHCWRSTAKRSECRDTAISAWKYRSYGWPLC